MKTLPMPAVHVPHPGIARVQCGPKPRHLIHAFYILATYVAEGYPLDKVDAAHEIQRFEQCFGRLPASAHELFEFEDEIAASRSVSH
jgi:hypothetical protein